MLDAAKKAGADAADALYGASVSSGVSYRLGKLEEVERAEAADLGLRVFVGQKVAFVSTSDHSPESIAELPEKALAMARLAPEDPFAMLAPPELLAKEIEDLDLADATEPAAEDLVEQAEAAEEAAMAVDGVTNSEGASASFSRMNISLATSTGFFGGYETTSHAVSAAVLAGTGAGMERDYDYATARHADDLAPAEEIGTNAGNRAVARLKPSKVKSQKVPVVYSPRVANGLLGHLAQAISGTSIARGVSFLKEDLGNRIFAPGITLVDDPHIRRGLRSKPFDGEGVANPAMNIVQDGILQCWLLDCAAAKQLGLQSNGRASRGTAGPPGPSLSNFYMEPGELSPADLVKDIKDGLYVVELMGMGVNAVTGDYSRGAAGFWIKNGIVDHPVSEITIAGNLKDMFRNLTPANDLVLRYGMDAPTLRIEEMTVAGA